MQNNWGIFFLLIISDDFSIVTIICKMSAVWKNFVLVRSLMLNYYCNCVRITTKQTRKIDKILMSTLWYDFGGLKMLSPSLYPASEILPSGHGVR